MKRLLLLVSLALPGVALAQAKAPDSSAVAAALATLASPIASSAEIKTSAEVVGQSFIQVHLGLYNPSANNGGSVAIDDQRGLLIKPWALVACGTTVLEGTLMTVAAASSVRTQLCMCTSDGEASPAFAWMNVTTGAVGTTTTCAP